jgi:CDP-diglyceride synthetase
VAKFSLRRFEDQALASAVLAAGAVLPLLAFLLLMLQNLNKEFIVVYGPNRRMAILAAAAATLLMSAGAFGFGLNSAGQRRNDRQRLSWAGFIGGAFVLAITIVGLVFFFMQGEAALTV